MDFTYLGHYAKSIPTSHETSWGAHLIYDLVGPLKTACKRVARLWQRFAELPPVLNSENALSLNAGSAWRKLSTPGAWLGDAAITCEVGTRPSDQHSVIQETLPGTELTKEMLEGTEGKESVLVPLIVTGGLFDSNHIVWVGRKGGELFYYDPKGRGPSQRARDAIVVLAKKYNLKEDSLIINKVRHQQDSHNCGVWGIKLMRDIRNKSFAEIAKPSNVDIEQARLEMAAEIVTYFAQG